MRGSYSRHDGLMKFSDIARVMACPHKTVTSLYTRAMNKLRHTVYDDPVILEWLILLVYSKEK